MLRNDDHSIPTPDPCQVDALRRQLTAPGRGVTDPVVIDAVTSVPRSLFVPESLRDRACDDGALAIGFGQTISQPYVVAYMTQALRLTPDSRVLEIGVGSGYQTAVLSQLCGHVYGLEIVPELAERARATLGRLGIQNVTIEVGDGWRGWPEHAPYDAVLVACAPEWVPQQLGEQLSVGGRMILPVCTASGGQSLRLIQRTADGLQESDLLSVRFVPMTGTPTPGCR